MMMVATDSTGIFSPFRRTLMLSCRGHPAAVDCTSLWGPLGRYRAQPRLFIVAAKSSETWDNATFLSLTNFTPMNGGTIHRCQQHTGNFSLPFVIATSCMMFSTDVFSSGVKKPSCHKSEVQNDGRWASEVVSRTFRNPVALRPHLTHMVGRDSD
jgi:hypothetical protein